MFDILPYKLNAYFTRCISTSATLCTLLLSLFYSFCLFSKSLISCKQFSSANFIRVNSVSTDILSRCNLSMRVLTASAGSALAQLSLKSSFSRVRSNHLKRNRVVNKGEGKGSKKRIKRNRKTKMTNSVS